jgi:hypothetical protein
VDTLRSPGPPRAQKPRPGGGFLRRWILVVTLGVFLGFSVPATVGALTANAHALLAAAAVVVAGAVEGAMLGLAQATVLRRVVPGLRMASWVVATIGGAVVAYVAGLLPSTLNGLGVGTPVALLIGLTPVLGVTLLLSIGTAQWLVLRRILSRCASWIAITAGAWAIGLGVFLGFTMPLWHPGQATPAVVAIGVAGGLLMAATTSAVTGFGMRALLDPSRRQG